MSLRQVVAAQKQIVRHDWKVITTWRAAQHRLQVVGLAPIHRPARWPAVDYAWKQMKWTQRSLNRNLKALRRLPLGNVIAWTCIHGLEGAWNANTGNGYYGGLQMDIGFQQTYGPELLKTKGTADHWTPQEQMAVAERARASRGYNPWPNTARACGLL